MRQRSDPRSRAKNDVPVSTNISVAATLAVSSASLQVPFEQVLVCSACILFPPAGREPAFTLNLPCRVGGWRADGRVRWHIRRFRSGPQSGSHGCVSSPRSPNPACRFPAPGSPVGSCTSYTGDEGQRQQGWGGRTGVGRGSCTASALPAATRSSAIKPVNALTNQIRAPAECATALELPFTSACDVSKLADTIPAPVVLQHPSSPGVPFLSRHCPASPVVRTPPPPCQPGLPLTEFQLARAHH